MALREPPIGLDPAQAEDGIQPTASSLEWQTYECTLVTPMYGGGVIAGEVDEAMPIRASAIRGQLRFWWRLACAQGIPPDEMFVQEKDIWGGLGGQSASASQVSLRVRCPPVQANDLVNSSDETHPAIKYAFGSASINGPTDWLKPGYSFQIDLRYPESISNSILTALRWWASFGGVGARTRRGFGAIQIRAIDPVTQADVERYGAQLAFFGSPSANAEDQWKKSVYRLYSFRQEKGIGRQVGNIRPGRSFWPEADQLRRFTERTGNGKHPPEHLAGNVFPRAAFGMPITFEFRGTPGEPQRMELHPIGDSDRMASPLILRPYWNGQKWQSAALLLPDWERAIEQPLKFKDMPYLPAHWPTSTAKRKELASQIKPMAGRGDDPLSAFMDFFRAGS